MFKKSAEYLYILSCPFLITAVSFMLRINDPDLFWHLKVGEYIVNNLSLPRVDIYSWSVYGEPWIAHQWFADVLLYITFRNVNIYGLWAIAFLCTSFIALFIYKGLLYRNVLGLSASIIAGITVIFLFSWVRPWPQVFMYALYSFYLMLSLQNHWDKKTLIKVGIASIIWANIHSSAVMFPILLFSESVWYFVTKSEDIRRTKERLVAAFVAFICTFLNPHGLNLWRYAVGEGLLSGNYRQYIISWMPYDFSSLWLALVFFTGAFLIYFVVKRNDNDCKLELMRALGFWSLTLLSRIYMPYAVMSTFLLLGFLNLKTNHKLSKRVNLLIIAVGIISLFISPIKNGLEQYSQDKYPVHAVYFIQEENLQKIFNDHGWGGYLLFKDIPVYMDGRNDVYRNIFQEYLDIVTMKVQVSNSIKKVGAQTIITKESSRLDIYLSEQNEWRELYRDNISVIYGLE